MIKTILILPDGMEISSGYRDKNAIQRVTTSESCNDGDDLTLGSVCSQKISIDVITPGNKLAIKAGESIAVYEEEAGERKEKGHYIAEKPQKLSANKTRITAYDNISRLDTDVTEWFNGLSFPEPIEAYELAKMVFEQCGITPARQSIGESGKYPISKITLKSVTGRQIIRWLAEICGVFCIANPSGEADFRWYEPTSTLISAKSKKNAVTFFRGSLSYEDYKVKQIDKVQIRQNDKDKGTIYPPGAVGGNVYIIKSNPFLKSHNTAEYHLANRLHGILSDIQYTPCKVSIPATGKIRVGDIITIEDANGVKISSYVTQKSRSGQKETIECTGNYERNGANALYSNDFSTAYGDKLQTQEDIAKIDTKIDENGAKIELVVGTSDDGGDFVKGSVLVTAINGQSEVNISADKVNLDGYVTAKSLEDGGETVIDGSRIQTGQIKSKNYKKYTTSPFSDSGSSLNLETGEIYSKKFSIDGDGNAFFSGNLLAASGSFAGDISAAKGTFRGGVKVVRKNNSNFFVDIDGGILTLSGDGIFVQETIRDFPLLNFRVGVGGNTYYTLCVRCSFEELADGSADWVPHQIIFRKADYSEIKPL